jgi:arylsulfatase A
MQNWKLELGLGSGGFTAPARLDPEPGGPLGQLYDLAKDPAEADNVYLKHPDVVARLTALLASYQQQGHSRPMRQQ